MATTKYWWEDLIPKEPEIPKEPVTPEQDILNTIDWLDTKRRGITLDLTPTERLRGFTDWKHAAESYGASFKKGSPEAEFLFGLPYDPETQPGQTIYNIRRGFQKKYKVGQYEEEIIPATWTKKRKEYLEHPEAVDKFGKESREFHHWFAKINPREYHGIYNLGRVAGELPETQRNELLTATKENPDYILPRMADRQSRRAIIERFAEIAEGQEVWEKLPDDIVAQQEAVAALWGLGGTPAQRKQLQGLENKLREAHIPTGSWYARYLQAEIQKVKSEMKPIPVKSTLGEKHFLYPYKSPSDDELSAEEKKTKDDVYAYMDWWTTTGVGGERGPEPKTSLTREQKEQLQDKQSPYFIGYWGRPFVDEAQRYDMATRRIVNENTAANIIHEKEAKIKEMQDVLDRKSVV